MRATRASVTRMWPQSATRTRGTHPMAANYFISVSL